MLVTGLLAAASPLAMGQALAQVVAAPGGPTTVTPGTNGAANTVTTTQVTNSTGLNGTAAGADAAAVGIGDIAATVNVAAGTNVAIERDVSVKALNDVEIDVAATAYAAGDSPAGMVAAYSDVEDSASATFSADLGTGNARAGSLTVTAFSNTTRNNVKAATDVGPTIQRERDLLLCVPRLLHIPDPCRKLQGAGKLSLNWMKKRERLQKLRGCRISGWMAMRRHSTQAKPAVMPSIAGSALDIMMSANEIPASKCGESRYRMSFNRLQLCHW